MLSLAIIRAQFGFNKAMNERLWTIIMEHLTDEQFVQELGYSRGSIRDQLVHMADAQRFWFRGVLGATDAGDLDAEDYPTRDAARLVCQQVDQESLDRLSSLSESDLERIPEIWSQPVWVALLQLAHHSTDHRAQILRTLYDLDVPTFEQNFAVYMENATPMTVQDLIGHIDQKRAEWDDLLRQVSTRQMNQAVMDKWTVRDLIAILTWTERRVTEMIRDRFVIEANFSGLSEAEQAGILAANHALPLAALLDQHQGAHHDMIDAIHTLTDADLSAEDVSGLPSGEPFWKAIAPATWWSYPGFSAPLRRLLQQAELPG